MKKWVSIVFSVYLLMASSPFFAVAKQDVRVREGVKAGGAQAGTQEGNQAAKEASLQEAQKVAKQGKNVENDIPVLDHTGKLHGELPTRGQWTKYSREDLKILLNDLKKSVKKRDRVNKQLETDYKHSKRLGDEHQLIKDIEKYLSRS